MAFVRDLVGSGLAVVKAGVDFDIVDSILLVKDGDDKVCSKVVGLVAELEVRGA